MMVSKDLTYILNGHRILRYYTKWGISTARSHHISSDGGVGEFLFAVQERVAVQMDVGIVAEPG